MVNSHVTWAMTSPFSAWTCAKAPSWRHRSNTLYSSASLSINTSLYAMNTLNEFTPTHTHTPVTHPPHHLCYIILHYITPLHYIRLHHYTTLCLKKTFPTFSVHCQNDFDIVTVDILTVDIVTCHHIFDCNLKTNCQILIIFGTNIPDTTCHQTTV